MKKHADDKPDVELRAEDYFQAARLGLKDLRAAYDNNPSQETLRRVKLTMDYTDKGVAIKNARTAAGGLLLKAALAARMTPEEQRPLWGLIVDIPPDPALALALAPPGKNHVAR